jgi:hypothetical protein
MIVTVTGDVTVEKLHRIGSARNLGKTTRRDRKRGYD